jgi:amidophosphoribosyltransferase
MVLGRRHPTPEQLSVHPDAHDEWVVASESLVLENGNYELVRELAPGEAVFITPEGKLHSSRCAETPQLKPCSFEYVYLARPDSVMNGISVYDSRLRMGARLAQTIAEHMPVEDVDVVMPIPDSARPSAMEVAKVLNIDYREGFFKNRYVGRTFIMPGQAVRKKSVRQKLNAMSTEFKGKHVLLVDDSIVRGTTSSQIIEMARAAGARKVTFASAAPPIRHPHVYGINIPTESELIAHGRTIPEICELLGADHLIYQEVDDLEAAIMDGQTDQHLDGLDLSCFTGDYITGNVTQEYLDWVADAQES